LDWGQQLPHQNFGVDYQHRGAFGLEPWFGCHAKILVGSSDFTPTRGRNRGGRFARQNFGLPLIGVAGKGTNQTAPNSGKKINVM
jgi:hypothetical protein